MKAKITIYDEDTGEVFCKDKIIEPTQQELTNHKMIGGEIMRYYFYIQYNVFKPYERSDNE